MDTNKNICQGLLGVLSALLTLVCLSSSEVHVYNILATQGILNPVCPEDKLVYNCHITVTPKATTVWSISAYEAQNLVLDQDHDFECSLQTKMNSFFTVMNHASSSTCIDSNLAVVASEMLNGQTVFCYNVGGEDYDVIGMATISVAGLPNVVLLSNLNMISVNIIQAHATNITYFVKLSQENVVVSNVTTLSNTIFPDLSANTNYTVTVSVVNCPGINAILTAKCTLSSAPNITVDYNNSIPASLTWINLGGCVSAYEVLLMTNNGSNYQYYVPSSSCFHKCNVSLNLKYSFEYYILNISSITDGKNGPPSIIYLNGTDSETLLYQQEGMPFCPNTIHTFTCTNTDLIPGETVWIFSPGTCPGNNDSIRLTRNAINNCSSAYGTCANFIASNQEPINGYCFTSALSVMATSYNDNHFVQCVVAFDNNTEIEGNVTISVVSPPDYNGVEVEQNLTDIWVELKYVDPYSTYKFGLVGGDKMGNTTNASFSELLPNASFSELLPNTRYFIEIFASNCAENKTDTLTVCTLAKPPANITMGFSEDKKYLYIDWKIVGGCVTKYRVKITTSNGSIIIDDSNVTSHFYVFQINESSSQTLYQVQIFSITDSAAGSPIMGPGSIISSVPFIENADTCTLNWQPILMWTLIGFVVFEHGAATLLYIIYRCKRKKEKSKSEQYDFKGNPDVLKALMEKPTGSPEVKA